MLWWDYMVQCGKRGNPPCARAVPAGWICTVHKGWSVAKLRSYGVTRPLARGPVLAAITFSLASKSPDHHLCGDCNKQTGQCHCGSISGRPNSAPAGTIPIIAHELLRKGKNRNPEIWIAVLSCRRGCRGQRQLMGACPSFVNWRLPAGSGFSPLKTTGFYRCRSAFSGTGGCREISIFQGISFPTARAESRAAAASPGNPVWSMLRSSRSRDPQAEPNSSENASVWRTYRRLRMGSDSAPSPGKRPSVRSAPRQQIGRVWCNGGRDFP